MRAAGFPLLVVHSADHGWAADDGDQRTVDERIAISVFRIGRAIGQGHVQDAVGLGAVLLEFELARDHIGVGEGFHAIGVGVVDGRQGHFTVVE